MVVHVFTVLTLSNNDVTEVFPIVCVCVGGGGGGAILDRTKFCVTSRMDGGGGAMTVVVHVFAV